MHLLKGALSFRYVDLFGAASRDMAAVAVGALHTGSEEDAVINDSFVTSSAGAMD